MRNGNSAHLNLEPIDGAVRILIQVQGFQPYCVWSQG